MEQRGLDWPRPVGSVLFFAQFKTAKEGAPWGKILVAGSFFFFFCCADQAESNLSSLFRDEIR